MHGEGVIDLLGKGSSLSKTMGACVPAEARFYSAERSMLSNFQRWEMSLKTCFFRILTGRSDFCGSDFKGKCADLKKKKKEEWNP